MESTTTEEGFTFAYADPPYINQVQAHYSDDPNAPDGGAKEVNHRLLIGTMERQYDAWALSMSATMHSLKQIIPILPEDCRMGAWVKPFASFKPNVDPAYTWEPVAFKSPRKSRGEDTSRDYVRENITMNRGTHGAKPQKFCFCLFDLVGLTEEDTFVDMFPGSDAVGEAYKRWLRARRSNGEQLNLTGSPSTPHF